MADALVINDQLPHVGPSPLGRLEFYLDNWDAPALEMLSNIAFGSTYPWIFHTVGTVGGVDLKCRFRPTGISDGFKFERHVHRVQYDNLTGTDLLSAADRIQIGERGYTDTLPGLFVIQPVPGTISVGVSCQVTVSQFNNHLDYWQAPYSTVKPCNFWNYGSTYHPYLRETSQAVTVSLVSGNHNLHVIPGVDLQFVTTPLESSRAVVAIGHEYCNQWSDVGDLGDIDGRTSVFIPTASYGLVPTNGEVSGTSPKSFLYRWRVYNVTGALQEGCQFHVRPIVRLDQGNAIVPFDQWFMGPAQAGSVVPPVTAFIASFSNYSSGSPPTITMHASTTVDMLITEIDPDTYVPTGTTHSDASGLKCDGLTLYRWDDLGVYFVLSPDANAGHEAIVRIPYGAEIERRLRLDTAQDESTYDLIDSPYSMDIGTWGAITGDDDTLYPALPYVEEKYFTGKIQTQGYDQNFFYSTVHATNTHWYNHDTEIVTYPGLEDENRGFLEWVVMVTCDDPRFFQVVPMTALPAPGRVGVYGAQAIKGAANVAGASDTSRVKGSANILQVRNDLALRVNQIQPDLVELLANHGVVIEKT